MGFYIALFAVTLLSVVLGWWLNDWWRELKNREEDEDEEKGKWDEL